MHAFATLSRRKVCAIVAKVCEMDTMQIAKVCEMDMMQIAKVCAKVCHCEKNERTPMCFEN